MRIKIRQWFERSLPAFVFRFLFVHKYAHFFITGVSGVALNLIITWSLTTFVFGLERYFAAFLIAISVSLVYSFILHYLYTFRTKTHAFQRMIGFIAYSISLTALQAWVVKLVTPLIGLQFYLLVISGVIFMFSVITFLLFKFFLFREEGEKTGRYPQLLFIAIFTALVIHLAGFMAVLAHTGIEPLISGDAKVYIALGKNILDGYGFSHVGPDGVATEDIAHAPGLPFMLVPFLTFSWGLYLYLLLQTAISAIALPLLVFEIGKRVFTPRSGLLSAWLIALEPQLAFSSWSPHVYVPFLIFALSGVLLFISLRNWQGSKLMLWLRALFAGICFGCAALVYSAGVFLVAIFLIGYALHDVLKRDLPNLTCVAMIFLLFVLVFSPWQASNISLTGFSGISMVNWSSVYIDYVATLKSIEKKTDFNIERQQREELALRLFSFDVSHSFVSPKVHHELSVLAIEDVSREWRSSLVGMPILLWAYFTGDSYYEQLARYGFVPPARDSISSAQAFMQEGVPGLVRVIGQLKNQYFISVVFSFYQIAIFFFAVWGWWNAHYKIKILAVCLVGFAAIAGMVSGFGMSGNERFFILPILFILGGYGIASELSRKSFFRIISEYAHLVSKDKKIE